MYVQHVLYRLEKKIGFLLQLKKNSRWTLSSLVVVHCSNPICSLQLSVECYDGFVTCTEYTVGAHLKFFEKLENRTASQNVQQAAVSSVRSYFHPAFA